MRTPAQVLPPLPAAPAASSAAVRASMQGNRSLGTKPELLARRALREGGFPGYRLHWKAARGTPDIAYPGRKLAVFVHGCYWHRCPTCGLPQPKSNPEYWSAKFARNVERDRRNREVLEELGWRVIVLWECEVLGDTKAAVQPVLSFLRTNKTRESNCEPHSSTTQ